MITSPHARISLCQVRVNHRDRVLVLSTYHSYAIVIAGIFGVYFYDVSEEEFCHGLC